MGGLKIIKGDAQEVKDNNQYSPNGKLLAFGSTTIEFAYAIPQRYLHNKHAECKGIQATSLCLDFNIDSKYLKTNCEYIGLLYWMLVEIRSPVPANARCKWATWTAWVACSSNLA